MRTVTKATIAAACVGLAAAALFVQPLEGHKPITSKYTYNEDVFPIARERCGRCHVTGGVGPMSLLTYKEAYPWAESIRTELLAPEMPPWHADRGFTRGMSLHTILSARELDVLLVWVTGGTPQGSAAKAPAPVTLDNTWRLGKPDLELALPEFVLAADKFEETRQVVIDTGLTSARRLKGVELRPGNPAIVRHAFVSSGEPDVIRKDARQAHRRLAIAEWTPGGGPLKPMVDRLRAGAKLLVTIEYKRTWSYEGQPMSDRSTIGLTFMETR